MIEYQAGDIWRGTGKLDDGEFLILAVNGAFVNGYWMLDKGYGDNYDVQIANKTVNVSRMYTIRLNALYDFIRSIPDDALENLREMTAKALGLNRVTVTGEPAGVAALKDDTIDKLQRELVKVTAQRDVFKELYLKREGLE